MTTMMTRTLPLIAVLLLASYGQAAAVTLTTPFLVSGTGACVVTNIGTKPVTVEVTIVNAAGTTVTPPTNGCAAPLGPRLTCGVETGSLDTGIIPNGFYCIVTASSAKVRAVAVATQGMLPATK